MPEESIRLFVFKVKDKDSQWLCLILRDRKSGNKQQQNGFNSRIGKGLSSKAGC